MLVLVELLLSCSLRTSICLHAHVWGADMMRGSCMHARTTLNLASHTTALHVHRCAQVCTVLAAYNRF